MAREAQKKISFSEVARLVFLKVELLDGVHELTGLLPVCAIRANYRRRSRPARDPLQTMGKPLRMRVKVAPAWSAPA